MERAEESLMMSFVMMKSSYLARPELEKQEPLMRLGSLSLVGRDSAYDSTHVAHRHDDRSRSLQSFDS